MKKILILSISLMMTIASAVYAMQPNPTKSAQYKSEILKKFNDGDLKGAADLLAQRMNKNDLTEQDLTEIVTVSSAYSKRKILSSMDKEIKTIQPLVLEHGQRLTQKDACEVKSVFSKYSKEVLEFLDSVGASNCL